MRSFIVHAPTGSPPPAGFPVVIAFHGGGMQGAGMQRITGLDTEADQHGFITLYPDGIDKHWNDGRSTIRNPQDDVTFVSVMLDQVEQHYPVDSGRIYATGLSNGALFVERLGCDLSERIAGIASVAGTIPIDTLGHCHPKKPIGVLQINGTADPIMPYQGGTVKDLGGRGEGGQVTSVIETIGFWARNSGCGANALPERMPVAIPLDPTCVVRVRYSDCAASGPVTLMTVLGGGHVWPDGEQPYRPLITGRPSGQIDASAQISNFFLSIPYQR